MVVSASHNLYFDNGLKVLGVGGSKLDHATEEAVTEALNTATAPGQQSFGEFPIDVSAEHDYARHLRALVPGDISTLSIVIDCANGAASHVAHELFEGTGATITTIHDAPNGRNINERCGSTDVADLVATVRARGADLGLALDGDADRLICVDENGAVRDGDDMMILLAKDRLERGTLGGGLVVTSMSNLGLRRALGSLGVDIEETDVGDRNVLMALEEKEWPFGGEQSGHLIFRDLSPTGDGLLTGLIVSDLVVRRGPLGAQASAAWQRVPQVLINISRERYEDAPVQQIFEELVQQHGLERAEVRLLIRPSGTEPVVRVMVEALDAKFVDAFCERVNALFS